MELLNGGGGGDDRGVGLSIRELTGGERGRGGEMD